MSDDDKSDPRPDKVQGAFICGEERKIDGTTIGCGEDFVHEQIYRCVDCDILMCKRCIKDHFARSSGQGSCSAADELRKELERIEEQVGSMLRSRTKMWDESPPTEEERAVIEIAVRRARVARGLPPDVPRVDYPRRVWVVEAVEAHSSEVQGVFTSRELADQYLSTHDLPDGAAFFATRAYDLRTDSDYSLPDVRLDVLEAAERICREAEDEYNMMGDGRRATAAVECADRIATFANTFRDPRPDSAKDGGQ